MRYAVDPWDPDYGSSAGTELAPSPADVRLDVEIAAEQWAPIPTAPATAAERSTIVFVDGVRRVDARAWIDADDGDPKHAAPGIFGSYAAGAVRCEPGSAAVVLEPEIGRVLVSPSPALAAVDARGLRYEPVACHDASMDALVRGVHGAMSRAEVRVAEAARRTTDDLIVVDGPLRERGHLRDAVGLVKTHQSQYLEGDAAAVVAALRPGERTPVFLVTANWNRHSWYLRLPGPEGGPWTGVVRLEASDQLSAAEVVALANQVSGELPRYASSAHKDSRAPQNLYPIGVSNDGYGTGSVTPPTCTGCYAAG